MTILSRFTFYGDGYRDGLAGIPASPPDRDLLKREYMSGYTVGTWARGVQEAATA